MLQIRMLSRASVSRVALAGAGFLAALALGASGAPAQTVVGAGAGPIGGPLGDARPTDLPRLPDGPVCVKDRDWLVVEAEQFIARSKTRAEELSRKTVELDLNADRDPTQTRAQVDATREEMKDLIRRIRDAEGYRDDARRLATRDCLTREGQGIDLRQAAGSVGSMAAAALPSDSEPMIEVKLAQAEACVKGNECLVSLVSETRRPATDDRRVAVLVDMASSAGTFVHSSDAWHCYATNTGAVCLAKVADLKPGVPVESRLTWKVHGTSDTRVCTRTIKPAADGRTTADPERVKLLQAVLSDYGYRTGTVDGRFADGTRVVVASAAPDFGIDRNGDDDRIAAALLGSMVSRVGVGTGPCLQLAFAADPGAATDLVNARPDPLAAPVAAPVAPPVAAPVVAPVAAPVVAAVPPPVRAPVPPPVAPVVTTTEPAVGGPSGGAGSLDAGARPAGRQPTRLTAVPPPNEDPLPTELPRKVTKPSPRATVTRDKAPVAERAPVVEKPPVVEKRRVVTPSPTAGDNAPPPVVVKKKARVVQADDEEIIDTTRGRIRNAPPAAVARPVVVPPPVSIGIGLGRRGGISFGF